jgi:adenylosuccinate lyase
MADLWSERTKYRLWFEIEAHAADAMAELGVIPREAAQAIWAKGRDAEFDAARIDEIEREVKHDVIAFLTHVAEIVGEEARFLHQGMTSSDVLDTTLAVQLTRAADLLMEDVELVLAALKRRAIEHKMTPTVGRSHGVHAEPTTFGLKLAGHYAAFVRARERLAMARFEVATCAISGAVGTFANIDPRVEAHVAEKMGLVPEPVSTQVIPRDRHAAYFAALAVVASSVENLAVEIRHLQRTEVLEAEEAFTAGQKGSSAMPHKRNPILTENLTGLARLVRSAVVPALEDVALWHERDISHSSVERGIAPDATGAPGLRPAAIGRRGRSPGRPPGEHGQEPRPPGRAGEQPAGAAGADAEGHEPGGRLRGGAAQRHEGLAWRRPLHGPAQGRRRGAPVDLRPRARGAVRCRLPPQARGHDLHPGVRRGRLEGVAAALRPSSSATPKTEWEAAP